MIPFLYKALDSVSKGSLKLMNFKKILGRGVRNWNPVIYIIGHLRGVCRKARSCCVVLECPVAGSSDAGWQELVCIFLNVVKNETGTKVSEMIRSSSRLLSFDGFWDNERCLASNSMLLRTYSADSISYLPAAQCVFKI